MRGESIYGQLLYYLQQKREADIKENILIVQIEHLLEDAGLEIEV